jgi:hypothetical protein
MLSTCGSRPPASRTICQLGKSRIVRTARHNVQHAFGCFPKARALHTPAHLRWLRGCVQFTCINFCHGPGLVRELSTATRRSCPSDLLLRGPSEATPLPCARRSPQSIQILTSRASDSNDTAWNDEPGCPLGRNPRAMAARHSGVCVRVQAGLTRPRHTVQPSMCSYSFDDVSSSSVKARNLGSGVGRRCCASTGGRRQRQQARASVRRGRLQRRRCRPTRGR